MLGRSHLTDIGDFGGTAAGHFSRIEGQRIANSTTDATQKAPELPLFESAYQHAARSAGADRGRPRREAAAQMLREPSVQPDRMADDIGWEAVTLTRRAGASGQFNIHLTFQPAQFM